VIRRVLILAVILLACVQVTRADDRHPVVGMVLSVDPAHRTFVASIEAIPRFMAAMTMPFIVKDVKEMSGLSPGAIVEFTLVVEKAASHAEGIRVRRYESVEQDPLAARRLSLLTQVARGTLVTPIKAGEIVPDFRLTDQHGRPVSLSQMRGKTVAVNFMYTTCVLPDFCLRIVNHFAVLQKRFRTQLGRDLMFVTITFDPARDTPDVLDHYARQWSPLPGTWHFLTGSTADIQRVLGGFGVSAFPDEGLMDHSLHTVIIDRAGRLVANVEGNQYSSDQLGDLIQTTLRTP
jgi:protein SCO1/2